MGDFILAIVEVAPRGVLNAFVIVFPDEGGVVEDLLSVVWEVVGVEVEELVGGGVHFDGDVLLVG